MDGAKNKKVQFYFYLMLFGFLMGFCPPFRYQDFVVPFDSLKAYFVIPLLFIYYHLSENFKSKTQAFWGGMLFMMCAGIIQLFWVNVAMTMFGDLPLWLSFLVSLLLTFLFNGMSLGLSSLVYFVFC